MAEEQKTFEPKTSKEEISEDLKELVITRLELLSPEKKFSTGSNGKEFTKDELIEHVRKEDEVGRKIIEIEITFLRALKDGVLLEDVLTSNQ